MLVCDICGSKRILDFKRFSICLRCFFYKKNTEINIAKIAFHYDTYTPEIHKKISQSHKNVYEFILKNVKNIFNEIKNKKALEIGFGHGVLLKKFSDLGFEVYGVDVSESAYDYAISIGLNKDNLYISDFLKTEFKDNFDLIIMNQVLEEFNEPFLVFKRLNNLLKSGGILIIRTKNSIFHVFASFLFIGVISYSGYSFKSLKIMLESNGFIIRDVSFILSKGDPYEQFVFKFPIVLIKKIITMISWIMYFLSFKKLVLSPSFTVIAIKK